MFRPRLFVLTCAFALAACHRGDANDAGTPVDSGAPFDAGPPAVDAGPATLTGAGAFNVNAAVALWGALDDGGLDETSGAIVLSELGVTDICGYLADPLAPPGGAYDVVSIGLESAVTLAPGDFAVVGTPENPPPFADVLTFSYDGGVMSAGPFATVDGGVTLTGVTFPTAEGVGFVSGGNLNGTFHFLTLNLPDGGTGVLDGTFSAAGCASQHLQTGR